MRFQVLRAILASLFLTAASFGVCKSQTTNEWSGFYPESYAREVAIIKAMPIYPTDAIQRSITGVVQAKIAIDDQGKVSGIRIDRDVDATLKQAVADAVDKWTFSLRPEVLVPGRNSLSRLTFKFSIDGNEPRVEFYSPGPSAKDREHLGYWNGAIELREWKKWEEVEPTRSRN